MADLGDQLKQGQITAAEYEKALVKAANSLEKQESLLEHAGEGPGEGQRRDLGGHGGDREPVRKRLGLGRR